MHKNKDIISFVKDQLWEPKGGLSLESRLFHDLGVDGEDGSDFLIAYCKEFKVPINEIHINKHFGPEAGATPLTFIKWLIDKDFREGRHMIPIHIRDLVECAEKGHWTISY